MNIRKAYKSILLLALVLVSAFVAKSQSALIESLQSKNHSIQTKDEFESLFKTLSQVDQVDTNKKNNEVVNSCITHARKWISKHPNENERNTILLDYYEMINYAGQKNYARCTELATSLFKNKVFMKMEESQKMVTILDNIYTEDINFVYLLEVLTNLKKVDAQYEAPWQKLTKNRLEFYALVHFNFKNYERAIELYKWQANESLKNNNLLKCASQLNNIGFAFCRIEKCDSAGKFYIQGLKYIHQHRMQNSKDSTYCDLLKGLINYNQLFKSTHPSSGYFNKAMKQTIANLAGAKFFKDTNIMEAAYYNLAEMEYHSQNTKQSILYTDSLLLYHNNNINQYYYGKALDLYAKNCMRLGQYKKADKIFHQKYHVENDLIIARTKFNNVATSTFYNLAYNSELSLSRSKLASQKKTKTLLGLGFVLLGLTSIALYYLWNKTKRDKRTIDDQNTELIQSLQEKEVLMKEIHHRVKNNLQVISAYLQLQSSKITEPGIKELFVGAENNIHSMITVHRLLYEHNLGDSVFIIEYLTNLVDHMKSSFTQSDIDVSIEGPNVVLNIGKAVTLGLIVSELFSNSYKHAFPTGNEDAQIKLEFYQNDKSYCEFIYTDNGIGVGLDELKKERKDSIGYKLIGLLCEEMDAELIVENKCGLTYILTFFDEKNTDYNENQSIHS